MEKGFIQFAFRFLGEMGVDVAGLVAAYAEERGLNAKQVRDLTALLTEAGIALAPAKEGE